MFAALPKFPFCGRRFRNEVGVASHFRKNDQLVAKIESRVRLVVAGNERMAHALHSLPSRTCGESATVAFEYHA